MSVEHPNQTRKVLTVRDLSLSFPTQTGRATVLDHVSIDIASDQTLALVGESGSGKSMTALAIMRLLPDGASVDGGRITLHDSATPESLDDKSPRAMRSVRGARIAMIFQEPMTSLNPVLTVGDQLIEAIRLHRQDARSARDARALAASALERTGIPNAGDRLSSYPHEFSGGMRQRVMIAMAMLCRPCVLIADEPTTALDATVQAQVLDLIADARRERNLGVLLITHDVGLVAERSERVCVMYRGRVVETGPTREVLSSPLHPYTRALLACAPRLGRRASRLPTVAEIIGDARSVRGTISGHTPWWPDHEPPPEAIGGFSPCRLISRGDSRAVGVWNETASLASDANTG